MCKDRNDDMPKRRRLNSAVHLQKLKHSEMRCDRSSISFWVVVSWLVFDTTQDIDKMSTGIWKLVNKSTAMYLSPRHFLYSNPVSLRITLEQRNHFVT